jgi:hypothetical protein
VLQYHQNNLAHALIELFPNLNLDIPRLHSGRTFLSISLSLSPLLLSSPLLSPQSYYAEIWPTRENMRKFFEEYAKENSFDPLNPNNWYSISRSKIFASKVDFCILSLSLLFFSFYNLTHTRESLI